MPSPDESTCTTFSVESPDRSGPRSAGFGPVTPCGEFQPDIDYVFVQGDTPSGIKLTFSANVSGPGSVTKLNSTITVTYGGKTVTSNEQTTNSSSVTHDLTSSTLGGKYNFSTTIWLDGNILCEKQIVGKALGSNPSKAAVKADLATLELQVFAYIVSRFRQFGPNGAPLTQMVGGQNRFGVTAMPLTDPLIAWDWRVNTSAAKTSWRSHLAAAEAYPEWCRKNIPEWSKAPDFGKEQTRLSSFHRMVWNTPFHTFDPAQGIWVADPTQDTSIATAAEATRALVESGKPPADW